MNPAPRTAGGASPLNAFAVVLGIWSILLVLLSAGAAVVVAKRYRDARKGWNLVPVVVVAVDVDPGTELTMEMLSQRSIPEQFVTDSVVRPEAAARLMRQRVRDQMRAGDPVLWRDLVAPGAPAPAEPPVSPSPPPTP